MRRLNLRQPPLSDDPPEISVTSAPAITSYRCRRFPTKPLQAGGAAQVSEADCQEKERLTQQYAAAASSYGRALDVIQRQTGVLSKTEYDELSEFEETARTEVEEARAALDLHTAEHGC